MDVLIIPAYQPDEKLLYIKNKQLDCETIAIMDCDGQHLLEDVERIIKKAKQNKEALVIGIRKIGKEMPLKSRLGNAITRTVFKCITGKYISDTQTGLRAFDKKLIEKLLQIKGRRYEYETNMLLELSKENTEIIEEEIHTIYHDKQNSCSHFRAVKDSFIIYKDLLKFAFISFSSFLLDYIIFGLIVAIFL